MFERVTAAVIVVPLSPHASQATDPQTRANLRHGVRVRVAAHTSTPRQSRRWSQTQPPARCSMSAPIRRKPEPVRHRAKDNKRRFAHRTAILSSLSTWPFAYRFNNRLTCAKRMHLRRDLSPPSVLMHLTQPANPIVAKVRDYVRRAAHVTDLNQCAHPFHCAPTYGTRSRWRPRPPQGTTGDATNRAAPASP